MPKYADARLQDGVEIVPRGVLDAYGLGTGTISVLETGSYNIHFRVELAGELFDLRRSNRPSAPGNLAYESAILVHLSQNGFNFSPEIVPSNSGESNVWIEGTGWTLFRWIGDDSGTQRMTANDARIRTAARVLAQFHTICQDLVPESRRGDWPIFTLPTGDPQVWLRRAELLADELDERLGGDSTGGEDLRRMARESATELASIDFAALPEYMCHGDYRMRNIQFSGDEITGVFDFDTSIRASRLLDIGGAVTRFSPLGGNPQADIGAGVLFLREYHGRLPISDYEVDVLPIFIRWRLLRDVVAYYDQWWLHVSDTCSALFEGAADEMVVEAGLR